MAATVIGIGLASSLILYFAWPKRSNEDRSKSGRHCRSGSCTFHALLISALVNESIDPCEDFGSYVCYGWTTHALNERNRGLGIMNIALDAWADDFQQNIADAVSQLPIARHVSALYESCMADSSEAESKEGVAQMRKFMMELRLPWPDAPSKEVDPLEVLLDIAFNWRLGIWFDVSLSGDPSRGKNLVFNLGSLIWVWSSVTEEVDSLGKHESVWKSLHGFFAPPGLPVAPSHVIEHTVEVHHNIYALVREAMISKRPAPMQFLLQEIGLFTANVTTARWAKAINSAVKGHGEFLPSHKITFVDVALLQAMDKVFYRYTNEEILCHLSWTFAQIFSSIADRQLLALKFGTTQRARAERHRFCAAEVESSYRWLASSIVAITKFPPDRRAAIDKTLNNAMQTVISKLGGLSWTDAYFRHAVSGKVQNISVTLWPPDAFMTHEGITKLYDTIFSNANLSFTQFWIAAMRAWRHYRLNHSEIAEQPRNFVLPIMRYNYVLNTLRMTMAALTPPWYYPGGTEAMTHGGLVFSYALRLVRAFDATGRHVDPEGTVSTSWLPAESTNAITTRTACLLGTEFDDHFPEIPAMEVAYAAFEASLTEEDRSVWVVDTLNEEQLFFVTACLTMCGLRDVVGRSERLDCNKAVANFPPFSKAFRCAENAKMNPPEKCTFFD